MRTFLRILDHNSLDNYLDDKNELNRAHDTHCRFYSRTHFANLFLICPLGMRNGHPISIFNFTIRSCIDSSE